MTELMIDLETMSLRPNAAIVSIGAVFFDLEAGSLGPTFHQVVSLTDCQANGLHIDELTAKWWEGQSPEAKSSWDQSKAENLEESLVKFNQFVFGQTVEPKPWSNGAGFDLIVMQEAYRARGMSPPWRYYHQMCYRTIRNLAPDFVPPDRTDVKHNALDDAIYQATTLIDMMKILRDRP